MTRRMILSLSLAAVLAVSLVAPGVLLHAQRRLPPPPETTVVPANDLKIMYIAGNKGGPGSMFSSMYLIVGGPGDRHTLALDLDDGVVLVDTKPPRLGGLLPAKVRLMTANPITLLVNTNPGGALTNSTFTDLVDVFAHENTKARLETLEAFKGSNARFLPTKTVTDTLSVPLKTVGEADGTNRVDLFHFGQAHSDGDLVAVFPSFGVAYLGELFPDKAVPTIDTVNGGSALAFPDTLARTVEGLKNAEIETIIPAHAPAPYKAVVTWLTMSDLQEYAEFSRAFVDAIRAAKAAGKSADAAVAGLQLPERFKDYGMANVRAYVHAAYTELAQ
jgi:cyclase